MRAMAVVFGITISIFLSPARADIPPPAYGGPDETTLGGLNFARQASERDYDNADAKLTGCTGVSRNCALVTKSGVIGWNVISAAGKTIDDGDLTILISAFAAAGPHAKIKLVFVKGSNGPAAKRIELSLDAK